MSRLFKSISSPVIFACQSLHGSPQLSPLSPKSPYTIADYAETLVLSEPYLNEKKKGPVEDPIDLPENLKHPSDTKEVAKRLLTQATSVPISCHLRLLYFVIMSVLKLPWRHFRGQMQHPESEFLDRYYVFQHINQRFIAEVVERSNYVLMTHIESLPAEMANQIFTERMRTVRSLAERSAKKYWAARTLEEGISLTKLMLPRINYDDTIAQLPHRHFVDDVDVSGEVECEIVTYSSKISRVKHFALGKLIIYLPGGAFVLGSHRTHRKATMFLARSMGCTVLVVNYRKAPEAAYPEPVEDALMAYLYAINTMQYAADDIIIMGDSAGGTVAALTTQAINSAAQTKLVFTKPVGGTVLWSPWLDLSCGGTSWTQNLDWMTPQTLIPPAATYHPSSLFVRKLGSGIDILQHPLVSPLYSDWSRFGPVLIQSGSHDSTASDAEAAADILRKLGATNWSVEIYEHVGHIFMLGGGSCSAMACTNMFNFCKRLWCTGNIASGGLSYQRSSTTPRMFVPQAA